MRIKNSRHKIESTKNLTFDQHFIERNIFDKEINCKKGHMCSLCVNHDSGMQISYRYHVLQLSRAIVLTYTERIINIETATPIL